MSARSNARLGPSAEARAAGRLCNKVAIITGGGSGFGAASAKRFVEEGARVALVDWKRADGEAVADDLGDAAIFLHGDISDRDRVFEIASEVVDHYGQIDVLYNNAGIGWTGEADEVTEEVMRHVVGVDLFGPWHMTIAALPALRLSAKRREAGASIVFTASGLGLYAWPKISPYNVAKHGVIGLMRSLAVDVGPENIRANAICPGMADTPIVRRDTGDWGDVDQVLEAVRQRTPLGRLATPLDIANAAVFFASDESRTINGETLVIDGGEHG